MALGVRGIVVGGRFDCHRGGDLSGFIELMVMVIEHAAQRITTIA